MPKRIKKVSPTENGEERSSPETATAPAQPEAQEQPTSLSEYFPSEWSVKSCQNPNIALCEEFDKHVKELDTNIIRNDKEYYISYALAKHRAFAYVYPKENLLLVQLHDPEGKIEGLLESKDGYGEMIVTNTSVGIEQSNQQAIDVTAAIEKVTQAVELSKVRTSKQRTPGVSKIRKLKIRKPRVLKPKEVSDEQKERAKETSDSVM